MLRLYKTVKEKYNVQKNTNVSISKQPFTETIRLSIKTHFDGTLKGIDDELVETQTYVSVSTSRIQINCVTYDEDSVILKHQLRKTIIRLQTVSDLLSIPNVVIWFVASPAKRLLPTKGLISPVHINGGFTYITNHNIYIYRCEEFPKVMMHELLHNSKLHLESWGNENMTRLKTVFNVDASVNLIPNEAVVEAWAEIFHTAMLCIELKLPVANHYKMMTIEATWARSRAIKMLDSRPPNSLWEENTSAFSYIMIRGSIIRDVNAFVKLYDSVVTPEVLTDFMIEAFHTAAFTNKNEIKNNNLNNKNTNASITIPSRLHNSLRMTWFGDL